jgi:DNA-directed RNA polymerase subunit M
MIPKLVNKKRVVACSRCGFADKKAEAAPIVEKVKANEEIQVLDTSVETLPTTKQRCPTCQHPEAYYWLKQTRAGDEPETRFFRCVKCKHTWREYA